MQEHHLRRVQEALEGLNAVTTGIDLATASPAVCRELAMVGDRLEDIGRRLASKSTTTPAAITEPIDDGADRLSHPLHKVEE
jgi:hypothetical protein